MTFFNILNNDFADSYTATNKTSKNLMFAGNFDTNPWQHGTTFAAIANNVYGPDMFKVLRVGTGVCTLAKFADAPTVTQLGYFAQNCLQLTVTTSQASFASGDSYTINGIIEGYNYSNIAQQTFTVSFWLKATVTGVYCFTVQNSGGNQYYLTECNVTNANAWQEFKITIPASPSAGTWNYTTGLGLFLRWSLGGGSGSQGTANAWTSGSATTTTNQVNALATNGNVFQVASIQVELGDKATPFEQLTEMQVLKSCQRFFQKTFPQGTAPAQATGSTLGAITYRVRNAGTFLSSAGSRLKVIMRATPTSVFFNPISANTAWYNITKAQDSGSSSADIAGDRSVLIRNGQAAGDAAGNTVAIHMTFSAEL